LSKWGKKITKGTFVFQLLVSQGRPSVNWRGGATPNTSEKKKGKGIVIFTIKKKKTTYFVGEKKRRSGLVKTIQEKRTDSNGKKSTNPLTEGRIKKKSMVQVGKKVVFRGD